MSMNAFNNGTKGFGFHAVGDTSDIFTIRLFVEADRQLNISSVIPLRLPTQLMRLSQMR